MAYETGWSPIIEFQTGQEVSNKFDAVFSNINSAFLGLGNTDEQLQANINIVANSVAPFYIYSKATNVDVQDTWTDICSIESLENDQAVFEYKFSATFTLDSATHFAYFRYSIDEGSTWYELREEPSDWDNKQTIDYFFPVPVAKDAGVHLMIQAMKEDSADVMTVSYADAVIEKKINIE